MDIFTHIVYYEFSTERGLGELKYWGTIGGKTDSKVKEELNSSSFFLID